MAERLPDWTRDELILAVDLYVRRGERVPPKGDPDVSDLSELLRRLPIHVPRPTSVRFRNPAGVGRKLADIHTASPGYAGKRTRGNKLDAIVLAEFKADPGAYGRLAQQIRATVDEPELRFGAPDIDGGDSPAEEGGVLEVRHYRRERNAGLVARKKKQALKERGALECEVCGFDFEARYGDRGHGFIECHHRRALADSGPSTTYLRDLALVCSNCHRMIHRSRPWLSVEEAHFLLA